MAFRSIISSRLPVVIILGATGTGKTKLGLELAQKFGTEVISADSMQVYKGLDVVTAKATSQERELVHHHLLDILEPHQNFTVVDFRNRTLKIMEQLTSQGKMPIIVGGTVYYLESVVYNILVQDIEYSETLLMEKRHRKRDLDVDVTNEPEVKKLTTENVSATDHSAPTSSVTNETGKEDDVVTNKEQLQEFVDNENRFTNEEIHSKLKAIDPDMASKIHPNNRRKILRSIEVWLKMGRRHSEILAEQHLSEGKLRYPESTIIFWLTCDQDVHDERLNKRVDQMLEQGLINELLDFHARHNQKRIQEGTPTDYTKGIFQTLGFKEFHDYLMLSEDERNSENGKKLLQECIEKMKIATRRYARRQNKMVKGRFLEHPRREVPNVWKLDTTDVSKWDEQVKNKAIQIIENFLNESPSPYEPLKVTLEEGKKYIDTKSNNYCEICGRFILGDKEFKIHLKSNRHMKCMKKKIWQEKKKDARENQIK